MTTLVVSPEQTENVVPTETNILKYAYNDMYSEVSKYIWNFDVVAALVELELEVYKLFPDIDALKTKFGEFNSLVNSAVAHDDDTEELFDSISKFRDTIQDVESVYVLIESTTEV